MKAVYAVCDEILPIFYAIQDKEKFRGMSISGYHRTKDSSGVPKKVYDFAVIPFADSNAPILGISQAFEGLFSGS